MSRNVTSNRNIVDILLDELDVLKRDIRTLRNSRPEPWHLVGTTGEPAFQNSWSNFGSGWSDAAFRVTSVGLVELRGLVTGPAGLLTTIFTLPTSYRPATPRIIVCYTSGGVGRINILANGQIQPENGGTVWISLDGIIFSAEQ